MGTLAELTVHNSSGSAVACSVTGARCMLENGEGGSHLELFNATIKPGQSLAAPVSSDASASCNKVQSQFTLDFSYEGGYSIGSVTLDVGRGKFKTKVVTVSAPHAIQAYATHHKKKRSLYVELVPKAVTMVNSWVWANIPALAARLRLPFFAVQIGKVHIEFEVATLGGLEDLVCTDASVNGSAAGGVVGQAKLTAPELFTYGRVRVGPLHIKSGLTLKSPKLSATALARSQPDGKMKIRLMDFHLDSADVVAKIGLLHIPLSLLGALTRAVEEAANHGKIHDYILREINKHLPGKESEEEAAS